MKRRNKPNLNPCEVKLRKREGGVLLSSYEQKHVYRCSLYTYCNRYGIPLYLDA